MRFWQLLQFHRFFSLFMFVVLSTFSFQVLAQTEPPETPEASWETSEVDDSATAPLTLIWQTEFTKEAMLVSPGDIAIDWDGNVFVSTQSGNSVKKFDSEGKFVTEWGGNGSDEGEFKLSLGIGVDSDSNVYVTDFYNNRIQKFDNEGTFLTQWASEPRSVSPAFLAVDAQNNVYIDLFPPQDEHYVHKFDSEGTLLGQWGSDDEQFGGLIEDIAVDAEGNLYVADRNMHRIQKLDTDGKLVATFGGELGTAGEGLFNSPFGVAVDGEGYIYVLDSRFLQKLDWEGNFVAQWSTAGGDLDKATNVAADADGNIYVFAGADVTAANGSIVNVVVLKKFGQMWP